MTQRRLQQIESIFDMVLQASASERREIISRACGDDSELRAQIETLLAHHNSPDPSSHAPPLRPLLLQALSEPRLYPGERIGAYDVIRLIGSGGMGEVYEARDRRLGRRVAIKLLAPGWLHDPEMKRRFEREARLASSLNHPNILITYDVGEFEGSAYLVTEFVDGENLRQRLQRDRLELPAVAQIIRQVASGLKAAHDAGIVHRDIKPENIMVGKGDVVRVVDFGLARSSSGGDPASRLVAGTLPYMSPEQLRGAPVDGRSDLWSLGVVMKEIAGPDSPFRPVIAKLLAYEPADRYQSAAELIAGLDALGRPARAGRRSVAIAAAVVLALSLAAVALISLSRAGDPRDVRIAPLSTTGRTEFAAVSADGRFVAYTERAQDRQSLLLRQTNEAPTRVLVPATAVRFGGIAFSPASDAVYFSYAAQTTVRTLFRMSLLGGEATPVIEDVDSPVGFSPDGQRIAFIRATKGRNWLIVAAADGQNPRLLVERRDSLRFRESAPAWSPDGKLIAAAAATTSARAGGPKVALLLFDANTGAEIRAIGRPWVDIDRIAWTHAGSLFVTARDESQASQVYRLAYPSGREQRVVVDPARYYDVTASSDARSLSAIRSEQVTGISISSKSESPVGPRRLTHDSAVYLSVDALTDSDVLAVSNAAGKFDLWSIQTDSGTARRIPSPAGAKTSASACPNGAIVYSAPHAGGCNLWRISRNGRETTQLTSGDFCDTRPRCSPDSSMVLFQSNRSGQLSSWSVLSSGGAPRLLTPGGICVNAIWNPDGRSFVCAYSVNGQAAWTTAVFPSTGGAEPERRIEGISKDAVVRWDPAGGALLYTAQRDRVATLFRSALDAAGHIEPVLTLEDDRILDFVPLRNGRIALIQGTTRQDAALFTFVNAN